MSVMPEQDFLNRTASLIEEHGWLQRDVGDIERGFCIVGAMNYIAISQPPFDWQNWIKASNRISSVIQDFDIVKWNNAPGRTKSEVVDMLRRAAQ